MDGHKKKMIAPIVISILMAIYLVVYASVFMLIPFPVWGKALFLVIPIGLMGTLLFVLIERIKEIRSGEEDDLSKY